MKPSNWSEINKVKMMLKYLRNVGREKIIERINAMNRGEAIEQNDILSGILMSASKTYLTRSLVRSTCNFIWSFIEEAEKIDLEMMIDNFLTFFIAGQETTANALAFSFLELGKNKDIFDK